MNRKSPPEAPANDSSPSQLGALVWGFLKWSVGLGLAGVLSISLLVALALGLSVWTVLGGRWPTRLVMLGSGGLALLGLAYWLWRLWRWGHGLPLPA